MEGSVGAANGQEMPPQNRIRHSVYGILYSAARAPLKSKSLRREEGRKILGSRVFRLVGKRPISRVVRTTALKSAIVFSIFVGQIVFAGGFGGSFHSAPQSSYQARSCKDVLEHFMKAHSSKEDWKPFQDKTQPPVKVRVSTEYEDSRVPEVSLFSFSGMLTTRDERGPNGEQVWLLRWTEREGYLFEYRFVEQNSECRLEKISHNGFDFDRAVCEKLLLRHETTSLSKMGCSGASCKKMTASDKKNLQKMREENRKAYVLRHLRITSRRTRLSFQTHQVQKSLRAILRSKPGTQADGISAFPVNSRSNNNAVNVRH